MTSTVTSATGAVISSALAASAQSAITSGSAGTGTLAGLILNLQMAGKASSIASLCDQIIRTPGLPAGAVETAEGILDANALTDPVARTQGIQVGISRLQAINTAASQQLGIVSRLFASMGL